MTRQWRAFWMRVRGSFPARHSQGDFDAELDSHLEMHTADNLRAGMTREEARRQAFLKLGGVTQTKQVYRDRQSLPWIANGWQDIRFGSRMLRKNPGFTIVAVSTLALGIGATTAMFSVVKAVLMASLPYHEPDRIVAVWTANASRHGEPSANSPGDFAIWKQRSGVFADLAPSYDDERTLTGQGAPQFLIGYAVSANYLKILGVQPRLGRLYSEREDRPGGPKVALLSDHLWRTTFHSDPNVIGKNITLDGTSFVVLGVMPAGFNYPTTVEIWTPVALEATAFDDFNHTYIRALGRLKPGVSVAAAQKAVNALEAQVAAAHPATDSGNHVVLVPLREQLDGDIRQPLLILLSAAGLVLLIACVNTAGLALARDAERQKEIAMRLALGATRLRLLKQFVVESLLLATIGGTAGTMLAFAGTHLMLTLFPNDVANLNIPKVTAIPMDQGVYLFATGVTLLTTLLFGIAPILKATRVDHGAVAKEFTRGSTSNPWQSRLRSIIVVTEVALSLMLLAGAGLVVASFKKVVGEHLGFEPAHALALEVFLPPDQYPPQDRTKERAFIQEVVSKLNALPGVTSAAATNYLPLSGFWGTTPFLIRGQAQPKIGQVPLADNRVMTPDYLRTMNIPLLRGRDFTAADRAGQAQVAIINRTLAKQFFQDEDPVGQQLNLGTPAKPNWWRIVGVAADVKSFGQDQPTHLDIFKPFDQDPYSIVAFVLRTEIDPVALIPSAEHALWKVNANLPVFKAIPLDLLATQTLAVRRASSLLISAFAVLALVLACIGIYAVIAYSVVNRTHEIGVRMALGAERADVLRMILGFGMRMTLAGILIGLAATIACSRLLASLLFQVHAIDPPVFTLASVGLLIVALLACFVPARRATRIDPMQALRAE